MKHKTATLEGVMAIAVRDQRLCLTLEDDHPAVSVLIRAFRADACVRIRASGDEQAAHVVTHLVEFTPKAWHYFELLPDADRDGAGPLVELPFKLPGKMSYLAVKAEGVPIETLRRCPAFRELP